MMVKLIILNVCPQGPRNEGGSNGTSISLTGSQPSKLTHPIQFMKKTFVILSAAILSLSFSSCASAKKEACSSCSSCSTPAAPALDKKGATSALKKAAATTPQGQAANAAMKAAN
jgi:hypothetical protein